MSPVYIRKWSRDRFQPVDYSADSLQEAAQFEPDGIYTVTNTFNTNQVLKLDAHLDRLEDSSQREAIPLSLDRQQLRQALRQMISEAKFGSVRFRVTIPRDQPTEMILTIEPFTPPAPALINAGVRCVTAPGLMRRNPSAKTTDWMTDRSSFEMPTGIYEALLVAEDGRVLEGFFQQFLRHQR